jgi:hypothetical protein
MNNKSPAFWFWASVVMTGFLLCLNQVFNGGRPNGVEYISFTFLAMLIWPLYKKVQLIKTVRGWLIFTSTLLLCVAGWFFIRARGEQQMNIRIHQWEQQMSNEERNLAR